MNYELSINLDVIKSNFNRACYSKLQQVLALTTFASFNF